MNLSFSTRGWPELSWEEMMELIDEDLTDPSQGIWAYNYYMGPVTLGPIALTDNVTGEFGWDGAAGSYVLIDPAYGLAIFFAMHVRGWPTLIGCGHAPIRDLTYQVLGL